MSIIKKSNLKKYIKSCLIWILSNTIWTIVTLIIPFTILIPVIKDTFKSITSKTYLINIYHILLVIIFCIVEGIIIYLIMYWKNKHNKHNIDNRMSNNQSDDCDKTKYDELDYYFEKYHKHLTVYKNGNGILINSFVIVINNINAITEFKREIKINDAKANTTFPKLKEMQKTKLCDRFNKFGFWYKCLNNENLIKSVREYYWSDNGREIDTIARADCKDLKWIMEMNPSSIEIGKPYNIVYIVSVPGMFPIESGFFSENIANIKGTKGKFSSQFNVKHKIKHFKYTVSFENELKLFQKPCGKVCLNNQNTNINYINDNNIIFDKYIFDIDNPECGSFINIEWTFMEKRKRGKIKKGGQPMTPNTEIERGD